MKKIGLIAVLLILSLCLLCGCANNQTIKPSPSDYSDYSSDTTEFDINNVTLTFYFGSIFNPSIENELENGRNYPYAELFFENKAADSQEPYFIKRTADSYTSEEYRCNWVLDDNRKLLGVKYNHHEEITVPKELFIGENGKITFRVKVDDINNEREDAKYISAISFLYEVKGTTVVINRVYDSAARYTLIK